jgi:tetratricopeptide (TPR) repeat protein
VTNEIVSHARYGEVLSPGASNWLAAEGSLPMNAEPDRSGRAAGFGRFVKGFLASARKALAGKPHTYIDSDTRRQSPGSSDTVVRLFVSSTFRDMAAEREILRREVFPAVRQFCEERGAAFFEIDLRWGVTQEEAESGLVLPLCLEEIDRCRPYVLGLIGARYGWVDPKASILLAEGRFGELRPYSMQSATELELRYAIVNRPRDALEPAALIYRRPHTWANAEERSDGPRISNLINALEAAGHRVVDTPDDLLEFARQVREDLLSTVAKRLPSRPLSAFAQARHDFTGSAKALGYRYVTQPEFSKLEKLVSACAARIAVVGTPGSGKSMMAAHLVRVAGNGAFAGTRVVGALGPGGWSGSSQAFQVMLPQLQVGAANDGAAGPGEARELFMAALREAARHEHVLAIIDGVDETNLSSVALPAWCPDPAENATIVVTLRSQPALRELLRKQRWQVLELGQTTPAQAAELSERFFAPFGRRLGADQVSALIAVPRSPLALTLLLEQVRYVPRFEELDGEVSRLAKLPNITAILDVALDRVEQEYGQSARAALGALALAPDGLSESVLQVAAGEAGSPLPPLRFCLLKEALGGIVTADQRRLVLRSSEVAAQILKRLPQGVEETRAVILKSLISALSATGVIEESLRHLLALQRWKDIAELLTNADSFDAMTRRAPQQLRAYWSRVLENDPQLWTGAYDAWIAAEPPYRTADVAVLAEDLGDAPAAQRFAEDACLRAQGTDEIALARASSTLASLAEARGDFEKALSLLLSVEEEPIRSRVPHASAVAAIRRARITLVKVGTRAAITELEAADKIVSQIDDDQLRAVVLDIKGAIALTNRAFDEAASLFEQLRALGDRLGDLTVLAAAFSGLSKVAREHGDLRNAEALAESALRLARISGDDRTRQEALGIAGRIAMERGNLDRAADFIRQRLQLNQRTGDVVGQLEASIEYAALCARLGDVDEGERIEHAVIARAGQLGLTAFETRR